MMMKATDVLTMMDEAGARGTDYLFGLDFELDEGFFVEHPLEQSELLFGIGPLTNCTEEADRSRRPELRILSTDREGYDRGFATVRHGLERGDTFLLNLTARTEIATNLTLKEIFLRSSAPYRLCWPGRFVCFSPERFVRISDNRIYTYPMKGTMDAALPDAERLLLDDYKETCEHYTIVDLMRNDLNAVARGVRVTNFRYVDRIRTLKGEILQTSSEICGDLPAESTRRMGSLFRSLLPAGSISGAPKPSTLRLIRAAEGRKRGFYTGVFGYCDGKNLDSAVMIRYIEQQGQRFFFHSGGGVTINSRCDDEYREVLEKVYLSVV